MLSNKLTFSLSFMVMLVFGLAFMATPVHSLQKYSAMFESTGGAALRGRSIQVIIPIGSVDDVEKQAGTVIPSNTC